MIDWQDKVVRPSLRCAVSGVDISPGDTFYSALLCEDQQFVRRDYSAAAWAEQDPKAFLGWWRSTRPTVKEDDGPRLVDATVLLGIFADLKDATDRPTQCFVYLLALLLMRLKRLRYLDLVHEGGDSYLLLEERDVRYVHKVRDPRMNGDESSAVEESLQTVFNMP